jgi:hypothetical protein
MPNLLRDQTPGVVLVVLFGIYIYPAPTAGTATTGRGRNDKFVRSSPKVFSGWARIVASGKIAGIGDAVLTKVKELSLSGVTFTELYCGKLVQ